MTSQHYSSLLRKQFCKLVRLTILEDLLRVILCSVLDECCQDRDCVVSLLGQSVLDNTLVFRIRDPFDQPILAQVHEAQRQDSWGEPSIILQYLTELNEPVERHIAHHQKSPLLSKDSEARTYRAHFEGNTRNDWIRVPHLFLSSRECRPVNKSVEGTGSFGQSLARKEWAIRMSQCAHRTDTSLMGSMNILCLTCLPFDPFASRVAPGRGRWRSGE